VLPEVENGPVFDERFRCFNGSNGLDHHPTVAECIKSRKQPNCTIEMDVMLLSMHI